MYTRFYTLASSGMADETLQHVKGEAVPLHDVLLNEAVKLQGTAFSKNYGQLLSTNLFITQTSEPPRQEKPSTSAIKEILLSSVASTSSVPENPAEWSHILFGDLDMTDKEQEAVLRSLGLTLAGGKEEVDRTHDAVPLLLLNAVESVDWKPDGKTSLKNMPPPPVLPPRWLLSVSTPGPHPQVTEFIKTVLRQTLRFRLARIPIQVPTQARTLATCITKTEKQYELACTVEQEIYAGQVIILPRYLDQDEIANADGARSAKKNARTQKRIATDDICRILHGDTATMDAYDISPGSRKVLAGMEIQLLSNGEELQSGTINQENETNQRKWECEVPLMLEGLAAEQMGSYPWGVGLYLCI